MGHGFQYQFWARGVSCDGGQFSRSTDGGVTWMTPINIPNDPQLGTLDVDSQRQPLYRRWRHGQPVLVHSLEQRTERRPSHQFLTR